MAKENVARQAVQDGIIDFLRIHACGDDEAMVDGVDNPSQWLHQKAIETLKAKTAAISVQYIKGPPPESKSVDLEP
jgi:hypothetical protein